MRFDSRIIAGCYSSVLFSVNLVVSPVGFN